MTIWWSARVAVAWRPAADAAHTLQAVPTLASAGLLAVSAPVCGGR